MRVEEESETQICCDMDSVFCTSANSSLGIFWKENPSQVNPSKLLNLFQSIGHSIPGFTLAIFDIPEDTVRKDCQYMLQ